RRHRPRNPDRLPAAASHRRQDRLPDVLGAAVVRRRLLPRSPRALRHDRTAEPALLRMDPRLDRHLPADLRRALGTQSRFPRALRPRGADGGNADLERWTVIPQGRAFWPGRTGTT